MTKFKKVTAKNGRVLFYIDGKMRPEAVIPETILHRLETELEFEIELTNHQVKTVSIDTKKCIFDGHEATRQKFLNGTIVGLCNEDYQTKTSGKIAQRINEIINTP